MCLTDYDLRSTASYTQKRNWSCCWGNNRTHYMYFSGSDRWKHACIQDLTANSSYNRRPTFPRVFLVIVFLSTSMILTFIQSNSSGIALLQSFLGFSISRLKRETNYLYYRSLTLIFFSVCKCKHIEYVLHESEKLAVVLCLHCCKKEWENCMVFSILIEALINLDSCHVTPI